MQTGNEPVRLIGRRSKADDRTLLCTAVRMRWVVARASDVRRVPASSRFRPLFMPWSENDTCQTLFRWESHSKSNVRGRFVFVSTLRIPR